MPYRVLIERIGEAGVPAGKPAVYEAEDEADAITIAAYEVDRGRSGGLPSAKVYTGAGILLFTYSGRARDVRP